MTAQSAKIQGRVHYARNLALFAGIAAMGGLLFGFDTAVVSGTIDALREKFALDSLHEGWVVSSALVGCIIGAAGAGTLSDRFGRKKILIAAAALFLVSAIGSTLARTEDFLIVARLVGGLGVGMASMVSPLYISEFSPASLRGRMVALYQFAIVVGILGAYCSNRIIVGHSAGADAAGPGFLDWIFLSEVWRGMFFVEVIPAGAFLLLMFSVPESPRWLAKQGHPERAVDTLSKVLDRPEARRQIDELVGLLGDEEGTWREFLAPAMRLPLLIGILLPFFSQVTAINVIIYYGPSIFKAAGLGVESAFGAQVVIGLINVVSTLVAIWQIDRFGRKPLLLIGAVGVSTILFLLALLFQPTGGNAWIVPALFFLHVAIFSMSWGPVCWVVIAEIYPTKIRGRAMAIATLTVWLSNTLVVQAFPWLRDNVGPLKTFMIYGLLLSPSFFFIWYKVPETKGKTLEEIEQQWQLRAHHTR